ncbi:MAG: hypothetical protein AB9M53_00860 [Leptothrix sp. (in: b-proteobacteria)]
MATAFSVLAGADVDTASEAWRHDCECRAVLAMTDRDARLKYLFGVEERWSDGRLKVVTRGVAHIRGREAADRIKSDAMKIFHATRDQK